MCENVYRFYLALTGSDKDIIRTKVESLGGTIEDSGKRKETCDYLVYPLVTDETVEENSLCDLVTCIWVVSFTENGAQL